MARVGADTAQCVWVHKSFLWSHHHPEKAYPVLWCDAINLAAFFTKRVLYLLYLVLAGAAGDQDRHATGPLACCAVASQYPMRIGSSKVIPRSRVRKAAHDAEVRLGAPSTGIHSRNPD
jgi:hypothetical protein